MATLGALAASIDKVEVIAQANAELQRDQDIQLEHVLANNAQTGITHHYKSTTTHTDTIEIDRTDEASARDKREAKEMAGEKKKSRCGCFGRVFGKR